MADKKDGQKKLVSDRGIECILAAMLIHARQQKLQVLSLLGLLVQ